MKKLWYALGWMCLAMVMAPVVCHAGQGLQGATSAPSQTLVQAPTPDKEGTTSKAPSFRDQLLDNMSWMFVHNVLVFWCLFVGKEHNHWTKILGTRWGSENDWLPCGLTYVIVPCIVALLATLVTACAHWVYTEDDPQEKTYRPTLFKRFLVYAIPVLLGTACQALFLYASEFRLFWYEKLALGSNGGFHEFLFLIIYPLVFSYGVIVPVFTYVMRRYAAWPAIRRPKVRVPSLLETWLFYVHRMFVYNMLTFALVSLGVDILKLGSVYTFGWISLVVSSLAFWGMAWCTYPDAEDETLQSDFYTKAFLHWMSVLMITALESFCIFTFCKRIGGGEAWTWAQKLSWENFNPILFSWVYPTAIACFVGAPLFVFLEQCLFPEAKEEGVPTAKAPQGVKAIAG